MHISALISNVFGGILQIPGCLCVTQTALMEKAIHYWQYHPSKLDIKSGYLLSPWEAVYAMHHRIDQ